MSLHLMEHDDSKIVEIEVSGKLADSDFQGLEGTFNRLVKRHGKMRVLLTMLDFHGWDGVALWDEVKFDLKHLAEIERLAVVGDQRWEKFLTEFSRPFVRAEVRFFNEAAAEKARSWLEGDAH